MRRWLRFSAKENLELECDERVRNWDLDEEEEWDELKEFGLKWTWN